MKYLALIVLLFPSIARAQPATQAAIDQAALEKEFEETMSGAVLVGHSSDSRRPDAPPRAERYTIQKVSKVRDSDDRWLFAAKVPFRGGEMIVPIAVPVKWAGDTPVLSLTDLTIPGMGTYTARVVIYRGEYAGTWSAGDHSGKLWGHIERAAATQPAGSRQ
jgi:hypothetical protein